MIAATPEILQARKFLEANGYRVYPARKPGPPLAKIRRALQLRAEGHTYKSISELTGLTYGQVSGIMWRYSIDADGQVIGGPRFNA